MTPLVLAPAIILAAAILNRVRGGGFLGDRLPGHPRFYVAPAIGLIGWSVLPWPTAAALAASFLVWSWLPWGRWFDLNRLNPDFVDGIRPITTFERVVNRIADDDDQAAFFLRNTIASLPAVAFVSPFFVLLPVAQSAAYEAGWRYHPAAPILIGELLTGAVWGVLIVAAGYA